MCQYGANNAVAFSFAILKSAVLDAAICNALETNDVYEAISPLAKLKFYDKKDLNSGLDWIRRKRMGIWKILSTENRNARNSYGFQEFHSSGKRCILV